MGGGLQEGYGKTAGRMARSEMVTEWTGIGWTGDIGVTAFTTDVAVVSGVNTGGDNDHATGGQGRGFGNNGRTTIASGGECRVGTRVSHGAMVG
jgi:hypothetical protein